MDKAKIRGNKFIIATVIIAIVTVLIEVFVFNLSSWKSTGKAPVLMAEDVTTDENWTYYSDVYTVDDYVSNVDVVVNVENYDLAYASVILTDEGDKYEYSTPEYTICNGVRRSGFSNIYPFDKVHTIQVKVRVEEGCVAHIESITANANIPVDLKPLRLLIVFALIWFGYMVWSNSKLHEIYFDEKKAWQWGVTLAVMVALIIIGNGVVKADKVLLDSPWPHHKQYQELAHNISENGTVELTGQYVDPALLEVENPYDTITLMAEGISFSMDYAYYKGHYYEYFGIVPELLFYYPYLQVKGQDMKNYQVMLILYTALIIGTFITVTNLVRKYAKSMPYFFYLMLCIATSVSANFIYLAARSDIYNVPILTAVVCTVLGIGIWLEVLITEKVWLRRACMFAGALLMALVAGCRPQFLIFSGLAIIFFLFGDGWKNRKLLTKNTVIDTVLFCIPYIAVAVLVCWYNYARFENIFDFGATYSLTTNDMNHRGFNLNRLLRSIYCYLFQPATINTDFPFLNSSKVDGDYMGRFLFEHTYGGILVANAMMISLWMAWVSGIKKIEKNIKAIVLFLVASGVIIAAFDANMAGVIYRYTCDFAPAFIIASVVMWIMYLDKSRNLLAYKVTSRIAYVAMVMSMAYALFTFVASGSNINLHDHNSQLFYTVAQYFRF